MCLRKYKDYILDVMQSCHSIENKQLQTYKPLAWVPKAVKKFDICKPIIPSIEKSIYRKI